MNPNLRKLNPKLRTGLYPPRSFELSLGFTMVRNCVNVKRKGNNNFAILKFECISSHVVCLCHSSFGPFWSICRNFLFMIFGFEFFWPVETFNLIYSKLKYLNSFLTRRPKNFFCVLEFLNLALDWFTWWFLILWFYHLYHSFSSKKSSSCAKREKGAAPKNRLMPRSRRDHTEIWN